MNKKTIRDYDYRGKRTLIRVDFNVPVDASGEITDDTRIRMALPTVRHLLDAGARLIVMTHFGRPKNGPEPKFALDIIARKFQELLGKPVRKMDQVVGPQVEKAVSELKDGEVILLENVRFEAGETKNDPELSIKLAAMGDMYVNDAFGSCHRAHCSTEGIAHHLPSAAGFLLEKEIEALATVIENPDRPFVAMIGGAKISSKIGVVKHLLGKADSIVIGGGMAFTFLKAQGISIGNSLCEDDQLEVARETMEAAKARGVNLILPDDAVAGSKFAADAEHRIVDINDIPDGWLGMDIGPRTIERISGILETAGTVVWNGPMGVFEMEAFSAGTFAIARKIAQVKARAVIGGGDSVAAINLSGVADKIYHISTGGGASLEMLEGITLPGIAAIADKQ
ncbi:MAG: phosphoglycerate kinase [Candidatus Wallbacteria bacterium HGW-Wallbacteria-1]|uniref:Phosphoglycerate kinase n=1 Tax=Candidatus Wallbacteria bacterium HGW-Wallbacteria-1 TaxID=2013854 RepID=A0A2N1PT32_9BACT|nr:MAG: phosphoglycerate kinase [Candidatus Wallbacteria bacterium HGW-Wallbacteria-1]